MVRTTLAAYTLGANLEHLVFDLATVGAIGNGNALHNEIQGGGGNDTLNGLAGNDVLYGKDGDDILNGGANHDNLYGGDGDDTLNGGDGSDYIAGGGGADVMAGGAGNDSYAVSSADDVVIEAANGGIDLIHAEVDLNLAANVENVIFDALALTVNGNNLNNIIYASDGADGIGGGGGADTLFGLDDKDVINGGDGDDVIEGGDGADTMNGGNGNDLFRYQVANPQDPNAVTDLGGDLIAGFETGKDKIDLYDLFAAFDIEEQDVIGDGYLRLQVNGNDTLVQFDKDGGGNGFVTLATVQNVTNLTLADLIIPPGESSL